MDGAISYHERMTEQQPLPTLQVEHHKIRFFSMLHVFKSPQDAPKMSGNFGVGFPNLVYLGIAFAAFAASDWTLRKSDRGSYHARAGSKEVGTERC